MRSSSLLLSIGTLVLSSILPAPAQTLKIATLAPEGSNWVRALRAIDAQLRQESGGAVQLKIYPGGVQGDERAILRKIRIGQLHGAGFAGQGVSEIFADILVLEMPFLFENYGEIDHVLNGMEAFFEQGYEERGFIHLGWADIGFVHILSKEPIRTLDDIRRHKVWRLEDEPITATLFRLAGVDSVPLTIPDVLLGLQTNLVDVVYAPPAAAIVLQWFTRVGYITQLPINFTLGALLLDARAFARLQPAHRQALRRIAAAQMRALTLETRRENEEAMQVMLDHGLQRVEVGPDELATFRKLVEQTRAELMGRAFSRQAHEQVMRLLAAYRAQHGGQAP